MHTDMQDVKDAFEDVIFATDEYTQGWSRLKKTCLSKEMMTIIKMGTDLIQYLDDETCTLNLTRRSDSQAVVPIIHHSESASDLMSEMYMSHDPQLAKKIYTLATFQGAYVNSGAEVNAIGANQMNSYDHMIGSRMQLSPSPLWINFGDYICKIDVVTNVRVPVRDGR